MRAWLEYAVTGLVVTAVCAVTAVQFVSSTAASAVWFAAVLAYAIQLVAFGVLIAVRGRKSLFLLGWLGGLVLRFAVVGVLAWWLPRSALLPAAPALVSLVAFVFALLLLEPLFLRRGLQPR